GFFFRFYNTPARYSLGDDSTRDGLVAMVGAQQLQFPLTGPFSSLGPFTFGPWYYYQLIIFSFLPLAYAPWIYLGISSLLFIVVMYKIGEELEGKYFGLITALLAALSPASIQDATGLSNPNLVPIFAALSTLLFIKLIKKDRSYWMSFLFGICLGIGMNNHYQMSGLLILVIILLIYKRRKFLYFLTALLCIFVTFVPLLFFDMNNHWYTVRNMFFYYTEGKKAIYVPNRWLFYVRDFWPSFWAYVFGLPYAAGVITFALALLNLGWLWIKKRLDVQTFLLTVAFLCNFILLRYYWGERGFGYHQFLYPILFIFFTYLIWSITKIKFGVFISIGVLLVLFVYMLPVSVDKLKTEAFEAEMQRQKMLITEKYPDQKLILYNCKDTNKVRAKAITLMLAYEKKIDTSGKKIGLIGGDCLFPKKKTGNVYPNDGFTVDFSSASEENILKTGWIPITPERVSKSVTRWWFTEQPYD